MKATELRIGNYYDQFGNIHQVTASILVDLEKAPPTQIWCKPIPLTEERLLQLDWGGYKKKSFNSYFKINASGCLLYCGDFTGITIKYVHQLQNLYFALTGEELTLKETV